MRCRHKYLHIRNIENAFDTVKLTDSQREVLKIRLIELLKEYSDRSCRYSYTFHTLRVVITVGSLIVPALLSVQYNSSKYGVEVYWIVWVLSLCVTISNGILTLLKIDKKYYTINTTFQHIMSEGWQYIELSGRYSGEASTHATQYIFFCHLLEKIRMKHVEDEYYKIVENTSNSLGNQLIPPTPFRQISATHSNHSNHSNHQNHPQVPTIFSAQEVNGSQAPPTFLRRQSSHTASAPAPAHAAAPQAELHREGSVDE